jgi:hypothetical protein
MVPSRAMRFGVIGPANGNLALLEKAATVLLFEQRADPVVYLGPDDAVDRLVFDWSERLVGPSFSEEHIWQRAAERCRSASSAEIDRFLAAERMRNRLKALQCLATPHCRTIEILEGRLAVLLYDKALLDEEDMLPASLLIFGKGKEPLVKQVGSRTFISPGELGEGPSGVALLSDEANGELWASFYHPTGKLLESHRLSAGRAGKVRVLDSELP